MWAGAPAGYLRAIPSVLKKAGANSEPSHRVLDSKWAVTKHVPGQAELLFGEGVMINESGVLSDVELYAWKPSHTELFLV